VGVDRRLGGRRLGRGRLDIDRDGPVRHEAQLGAAGQHALTERATQLGQQRAERRVGRGGRVLGPQQVDQLGPPAVAIAVEDEVREQQSTLPPGQGDLRGMAVAIHSNRPAEPYGRARRLTHAEQTLSPHQGFSKVSPTGVADDPCRGDGNDLRRRELRHGRCRIRGSRPGSAVPAPQGIV
jgi:hypothetical protein